MATWWYGKQTLKLDSPCGKLEVRSRSSMPAGNGKVDDKISVEHDFRKISTGRIGNWLWELLATPRVAQAWMTAKRQGEVGFLNNEEGRIPRVSWRRIFRQVYFVYRYVLASPPPETRFYMHLFPSEQVIDNVMLTRTDHAIILPFFVPYVDDEKRTIGGIPIDGWQDAYYHVIVAASFEYMHALFFTNQLNVPNLLGQSVAAAMTMDVLLLICSQGDVRFSLTFPGTKDALARAHEKKSLLLDKGDVDDYGGLLAAANIAHVLGSNTRKITIHSGDHAKILRLLKLVRAMLQEPIDFTKHDLYPLGRLNAIPDYTGTQADIPRR